jgi:hypothetical protein
MASKGLKTEDTKTEHPFQAIVVCDGWGDEERWGPLVRRKRTEDEEYDDLEVGGEQRPWVSDGEILFSFFDFSEQSTRGSLAETRRFTGLPECA